MKKIIPPALLCGVLTSILAVSTAHASEPIASTSPDSDLIKAQQLMQGKQPQAACTLLQPTTGLDSQDVDKLYLMGLCSTEIGQGAIAADYFRRVIALQPALPRPRAKLAQIYIAEGKYAEAGRLFAEAAERNTDQSGTLMMRDIANRLQAVDVMKLAASMGKPWTLQLYAGLVSDDNVNAGPLSRSVPAVLGGVPITFELTDAAMPRSSTGMATGVSGSYLVPLNQQWSFILRGNYFGTRYFSQQNFSNDSLSVAGDFVFRDQSFAASIQPNVRYTRLDGQVRERASGITSRVEQRLSAVLALTGSFGYQDRAVPVDRNRDADVLLASAGLSWQASTKVVLGGEYVFQKDKANSDIYSRRLTGPSVTVAWQPMQNFMLMGSYSYLDAKYEEKMALFPAARDDKQKVASLTALWSLNPVTALRLQYVKIDNPSNIAYNRFEREVVSFGVQFSF